MSSQAEVGLAVKLFLDMRERTEEAVADTGKIDVAGLVSLLRPALANDRQDIVLRAIAEFIGTALDGTVIEVRNWTPSPPPVV